jgi:phage major head subunit gpT-like protein
VSNKLTVALSNASLAAAMASYGAARTAMMNFKDEENRPLNVIPDTLEVPPALEAVGNLLLTADKLGDDSPNPYKGTAKLLVNTRLTSSTAWFLHCTTRPLKPFLFQERKKPVFVQQTDTQSDDVFDRGAFKFGAEARSNGGYGLWHTSVGSTGEA